MVEKKQWYLSRTLWLNLLVVLATVLSLAADWTFVTKEIGQMILTALAAVNVVLRLLTSEPITVTATRKANEETL